MTDVCLVHMPYGAVERPSIALGILKAVLVEAGIGSEVLYPNIWFAEEVGLDVYMAVVKTAGRTLIGDWTFAGAAFPDHVPDFEEYHRFNQSAFLDCPSSPVLKWTRPGIDLREILNHARTTATRFVDRVADAVLASHPRIVGCSATFQQHCASLALLRRIRVLAPDVITLLGGANCEGSMGAVTHREFDWVDYVVSGEADTLIVDLCRGLLGRGRDFDAEELPYGVIGPASRRRVVTADGTRGYAAPRAMVDDLDTVPQPDYDAYFRTLEASAIAPYILPGLLVETARGCWWGEKRQCPFCGLNGEGIRYRSKSAERVLADLASLAGRHQISSFAAVDNILDYRYFKTVLPGLAECRERYSLFFETKANLRREHLEALARAGVRWIQPGIESMHPAVLELLKKGNTVWTNLQLLRWGLEFGVRVEWLFLWGIPGEDDAWYREMAEWLPLIAHLEPPAGVVRIEYHRFSPYQQRPDDYGIALAPTDNYRHVYPFSAEAIADLAYYFDDHGRSNGGPRLVTGGPERGLTTWAEAIKQWRLDWLDSQTPDLSLHQVGRNAIVVDTRRCAIDAEYHLSGIERAAIAACDHAVTADALATAVLGPESHMEDRARLEAAVTELCRRKILLELGGRYLCLPVTADRPPRPTRYPGGEVLLQRYVRDRVLAMHATGQVLASYGNLL